MPNFAPLRHGSLITLLIAPNLLLAAHAASVSGTEQLGFGQTVVNSQCAITPSNGAIGVKKDKTLITSDSSITGQYNSTPSAASISVTSNLTEAAKVIVDNVTLSGPTAATLSQVRLGSGTTYDNSAMVDLGTDGALASTAVNVKFETTNNKGRFDNGTYTASATVTCTDNGTK
jgi:hypothetical protein